MGIRELLGKAPARPRLYGTTPPSVDADDERILRAAHQLAERTTDLECDAFVVYDVQDESARNAAPRPFPYMPMIDPRRYASLLRDLTKRDCVVYKCISGMNATSFTDWLDETAGEFGFDTISLVGAASSSMSTNLPLTEALRIASDHPAQFLLGGVAIPERHSPDRSESRRLLRKTAHGCSYFISQAVYDAEPATRFLNDYASDCASDGVEPCPIVLTFTPCGRPETMNFMKWLGITVPADVERAILTSTDPPRTSIDLCVENWRRLSTGRRLGVNVESVSNKKVEILASIELLRRLGGSMSQDAEVQ